MSGGSSALQTYRLGFECSPIILTNGIAQLMPGSMLPIIALTEGLSFTTGLLSGVSPDFDLDQCFAHFRPVAGSSLIDNVFGEYPFANQATAANAIIVNPLKISLLMSCPANENSGGFLGKLAILTALVQALALHSQSGGTYTIATPAQLYPSCLLRRLVDVSAGQVSQPQSLYQWDFEQPLLTETQAQRAFNGMMSKVDGGLPSTGALSGPEVTGSPSSLATGQIVPSASNTVGSGFSNSIPQ